MYFKPLQTNTITLPAMSVSTLPRQNYLKTPFYTESQQESFKIQNPVILHYLDEKTVTENKEFFSRNVRFTNLNGTECKDFESDGTVNKTIETSHKQFLDNELKRRQEMIDIRKKYFEDKRATK